MPFGKKAPAVATWSAHDLNVDGVSCDIRERKSRGKHSGWTISVGRGKGTVVYPFDHSIAIGAFPDGFPCEDVWKARVRADSRFVACKEATEALAMTNPDDCCPKVPWCKKQIGHIGYCSPHTLDSDSPTVKNEVELAKLGEGGTEVERDSGCDGEGEGGGEGVTLGIYEAFEFAQAAKRTELASKELAALHQRVANSEAQRLRRVDFEAHRSYGSVNRPLSILAALPPAVDASPSEMAQEMLQMQAADTPTSRLELEARSREKEASRRQRSELVIGKPQTLFAGATIGGLTVTKDQAQDVISKANINDCGGGSLTCAWSRRAYLDMVATTACSKDAAASAELHALPRERYAFLLQSTEAGTIRLAIETDARTSARRRPWRSFVQHLSEEVPEEVVLESREVECLLEAAGHGALYPQICKISEDAGTPRTYEAALESHRTPGKNLYHLLTATLGVDVPGKASAPSATKPAPGLPLSGAATQPLTHVHAQLTAHVHADGLVCTGAMGNVPPDAFAYKILKAQLVGGTTVADLLMAKTISEAHLPLGSFTVVILLPPPPSFPTPKSSHKLHVQEIVLTSAMTGPKLLNAKFEMWCLLNASTSQSSDPSDSDSDTSDEDCPDDKSSAWQEWGEEEAHEIIYRRQRSADEQQQPQQRPPSQLPQMRAPARAKLLAVHTLYTGLTQPRSGAGRLERAQQHISSGRFGWARMSHTLADDVLREEAATRAAAALGRLAGGHDDTLDGREDGHPLEPG